jgi:hypothetical protein
MRTTISILAVSALLAYGARGPLSLERLSELDASGPRHRGFAPRHRLVGDAVGCSR